MIRWQVIVLAALALAATSGCRILVELVESGDGEAAGVDGGVDAGEQPDANRACDDWSYAPALVDPCEAPEPTEALTLGAGEWSYDTNSGALTSPEQDATFPASVLWTPPSGPELRIVSVDKLDVDRDAVLRVHGRRPLVVVSWSRVRVRGLLDLDGSAIRAAAGADPGDCAQSGAGEPGAPDTEGAGGGGGGGFGTAGAAGGTGHDMAAAAGAAGEAAAAIDVVRGGCPGGAGGNDTGGVGGSAGGAVLLVARDRVEIEGTIAAGGAGGGGGNEGRGGGGGGGSGGYIGLDAPEIIVDASAVLAANGGGGGGGCDNKVADPGEDGARSGTPAAGGAGEGMGEDGGDGAAEGASSQPGVASSRGGGGGGGGAGAIILYGGGEAIDGAAIISPAAQAR